MSVEVTPPPPAPHKHTSNTPTHTSLLRPRPRVSPTRLARDLPGGKPGGSGRLGLLFRLLLRPLSPASSRPFQNTCLRQ